MRTNEPDRPSLELDDYSGPFQPDLHLSDFSKEGLMKLVEIGGSIYGAVNRQWYQAAVERFGQKVADEMHHEVWFCAHLELFGFRHGAARWNEKVRIIRSSFRRAPRRASRTAAGRSP